MQYHTTPQSNGSNASAVRTLKRWGPATATIYDSSIGQRQARIARRLTILAAATTRIQPIPLTRPESRSNAELGPVVHVSCVVLDTVRSIFICFSIRTSALLFGVRVSSQTIISATFITEQWAYCWIHKLQAVYGC